MKNITRIYFMRHGEVHNPKKVIYGRLPHFPLSEKGRTDIAGKISFFRKKKINIIFSSPLLRARQTAKIISKALNVKYRTTKMISEIDMVFEGMDLEEYKSKYQPFLYEDKILEMGSESIESIKARMMKFLKKILKKYKNKNILVISHGDPIMILRSSCLNIPFTWEYKKENYLQTSQVYELRVTHGKLYWK